MRITGQLIDTATGAHIWADRFDGRLDDIFDLQEQVARSVVGAIEPRLRQSEIERATRKPIERLDVYDLYLLALAELRKFTDKACEQALALLGRAVTIDPSYAPTAAMTGWCRVHQLVQGWKQLSDEDVADGVRLAKQAAQSGRHDPDALWMAGYTLSVLDGDHTAAATAIDRALDLNPSSADAWSAKGWVACFRNQPGLAIEALHRAMRLSPLDPREYRFSAGLALAHLVARRYEEALEWADRSVREQPRYSVAIRMRVVLCAHLGQVDEARAWLGRLLGATGIDDRGVPDVGREIFSAGHASGLRRRLSEGRDAGGVKRTSRPDRPLTWPPPARFHRTLQEHRAGGCGAIDTRPVRHRQTDRGRQGSIPLTGQVGGRHRHQHRSPCWAD